MCTLKSLILGSTQRPRNISIKFILSWSSPSARLRLVLPRNCDRSRKVSISNYNFNNFPARISSTERNEYHQNGNSNRYVKPHFSSSINKFSASQSSRLQRHEWVWGARKSFLSTLFLRHGDEDKFRCHFCAVVRNFHQMRQLKNGGLCRTRSRQISRKTLQTPATSARERCVFYLFCHFTQFNFFSRKVLCIRHL